MRDLICIISYNSNTNTSYLLPTLSMGLEYFLPNSFPLYFIALYLLVWWFILLHTVLLVSTFLVYHLLHHILT